MCEEGPVAKIVFRMGFIIRRVSMVQTRQRRDEGYYVLQTVKIDKLPGGGNFQPTNHLSGLLRLSSGVIMHLGPVEGNGL